MQLKTKPSKGVLNLLPYQPGKPINELRRELGIDKVIKLASNENPLGVSSAVANEINDKVNQLNYYPDGSGYELKQKIASFKGCEQGQIVLGNGSDEIFTLVQQAFCDKGDAVLISEYAFAAYGIAARALGLKLQVAPVLDNLQQDLAAMLEQITSDTKVIFLANPNNPTASWHKDSVIKDWLEKVPQNIIVVIDQAYYEYMLKTTGYTDAAIHVAKHPNLIVTYTFSKAYGLAGLRLGYAICQNEVADLLNRPRLPFNANSLAQVAGVAALSDVEYIQQTLAINSQGVEFYKDGLSKHGIEFLPQAGNFITIKIKDSSTIFNSLLHQGIIVRPLIPYKMHDYLRISIGKPEENEFCLKHLIKAISK